MSMSLLPCLHHSHSPRICFLPFTLTLLSPHLLSLPQAQGSSSSTAINTAVNFAATAAYGKVLFDDEIDNLWCAGFSLILLGALLLAKVTAGRPEGREGGEAPPPPPPAAAASPCSARAAATSFSAFEREQKELAEKQLSRRRARQANRTQAGGYSPSSRWGGRRKSSAVDKS